MAYQIDEEDDEQTAAPRSLGAGSASVTQGVGQAAQQGQAGGGQVESGSGYIPVQRYMDVNQNAGSQMVDQLTGNVRQQADSLNSDLTGQWKDFQSSFNQPVATTSEPATTPAAQPAAQQGPNKPYDPWGTAPQANMPYDPWGATTQANRPYDPSTVRTESVVKPLQTTPQATPESLAYTGPDAWAQGDALHDRGVALDSQLGEWNSLEGIQSQLQKGATKEGQNYTAGQSLMDALLTQANSGNSFTDAQAEYGGLNDQISGRRTEAEGMITDAKSKSAAAVAAAKQAQTAGNLKAADEDFWTKINTDPDVALALTPKPSGIFGLSGSRSTGEGAAERLAAKYGPDWQAKAEALKAKYGW